MPTYEFECPDGHRFDRFYRKISEAPSELSCPECGQPATRRVSGGAGLIFKGSGFYITDYGKDGKKQPATPAPAAGESKGTGEGGSTGTPAPEGKAGEESKPAVGKPAGGAEKKG